MIINTEIIYQPEIKISGISVRTINQNGQSGRDMTALWGRFMGDRVFWQYQNRVSDEIYCAYTDYETDHTGYYTAVLGCSVSSLSLIPNGFIGIAIPKDKYCVYSLSGKCPGNVLDAWEEIWLSNADRKYTFDFDVYKPDAKNFEDSEVKIFLSIN